MAKAGARRERRISGYFNNILRFAQDESESNNRAVGIIPTPDTVAPHPGDYWRMSDGDDIASKSEARGNPCQLDKHVIYGNACA